jgi:hypothetical protein
MLCLFVGFLLIGIGGSLVCWGIHQHHKRQCAWLNKPSESIRPPVRKIIDSIYQRPHEWKVAGHNRPYHTTGLSYVRRYEIIGVSGASAYVGGHFVLPDIALNSLERATVERAFEDHVARTVLPPEPRCALCSFPQGACLCTLADLGCGCGPIANHPAGSITFTAYTGSSTPSSAASPHDYSPTCGCKECRKINLNKYRAAKRRKNDKGK